MGRQIALQQLDSPAAEAGALPDTGGVELAPRAVLPLAGLGLVAVGAGVYALRRRFG